MEDMEVVGAKNKALRPANGACISLLKTISAMTIFKSVAAFLQSMMPRRQQGVYFQYFSASPVSVGSASRWVDVPWALTLQYI